MPPRVPGEGSFLSLFLFLFLSNKKKKQFPFSNRNTRNSPDQWSRSPTQETYLKKDQFMTNCRKKERQTCRHMHDTYNTDLTEGGKIADIPINKKRSLRRIVEGFSLRNFQWGVRSGILRQRTGQRFSVCNSERNVMRMLWIGGPMANWIAAILYSGEKVWERERERRFVYGCEEMEEKILRERERVRDWWERERERSLFVRYDMVARVTTHKRTGGVL